MGLFDLFKKKRTAASAPVHIPQGAPSADCYSYRGSVDEYFARIFAGCFPELRVFRDERLAGPDDIPVTFLLYRDGAPKLAVILCDSQEYDRRRITNTMDACKERNIPVQRYFRNFRNNAQYVIDRVSKAL